MTSKLIRAAAVAALAAGLAHAADATPILVSLAPPATAGATAWTGSFTDTISSAGTFTADFLFAAPPPTSFDSFSALVTSGITFTGVSLSPYGSGNTTGLDTTLSATSIASTTPSQVNSGLYDLQITGIATVGGKFTGSISAVTGGLAVPVSPVPEPASTSLLLAGLGALALVARRRATPQG